MLNPEKIQWSIYRELHHDLVSFHDERFMQICVPAATEAYLQRLYAEVTASEAAAQQAVPQDSAAWALSPA